MAKNKLNKNWIHDHINDPYVKLAQKEGYRARAAFKLKEIDEEEKLDLEPELCYPVYESNVIQGLSGTRSYTY